MMRILPLIALILLGSCSSAKKAQYHYKKALKHGLQLVTHSDTIRITALDSFAVVRNDTIVWEKFITTKDTIIQYNNIYVPKTRWQTRIEYRYKTKVLKQDVLKYKYIYRDGKLKKARTNWMLFVYGLLAGFVVSFVLRLLDKIYNPLR